VGDTRIVQQAYQFELDPNEAQRVLLAKSVGTSRFVYNWGWTRGFQGRILSATIRRRADRWFVSLCVKRERQLARLKEVREPSDVVGVDLGLRDAAVIHDGRERRVVEAKQALRKHLKKLARLNRQVSRKRKGSHNRKKAKLELARLHYRISCLRQDHPTNSLAHWREPSR
jgi:putative transposase